MTSSSPQGHDPTESRPGLSVVVPSVNAGGVLIEVLEALGRQEGVERIEVLLPERTGSETRETVRRRFPEVRLLEVEPGTPIPTMRRLAFASASADVIAVIEDHVIVPPDWAARLVDTVGSGHRVVGGWVRNAAVDRLSDRAAFICEYGHMLVPLPSGPAAWVTGNNVAYRRDLIEAFWSVVEEDRWEDRLHSAFQKEGIELYLRSDIVVDHKMLYRSALEYVGQRFLYSRAYAGMRLRGAGRMKGLAYGLAAFLLPPVLLLRIVKNGWATADSRSDVVKSLPLLALFVSAWSVGEAVGALVGPGDALGRVR